MVLPTRKATAFLNLLLGGTGIQAGWHLHQLLQADRRPFPMSLVQIDTDPQPASFVDHTILIPLDGQKVQTILASPDTFGPVAKAIVQNYPHYLNPEDIQNGARTTRMLTQLAFIYYRETIVPQLRNAVLDLLHQGGFDHILPVLISSSGGGTGSAMQILLGQALSDPGFFSRLTEGLPGNLLQTPILFVVEPYSFALRNQSMHADKVLGNAYAFRIESALLEEKHAYKYCFHLGLANDDGAVLDSPDEIAKVLGTSVYQMQRHWPQIKSRLVDLTDIHSISGRYTGADVPEMILKRTTAPCAQPSPNGTAPAKP